MAKKPSETGHAVNLGRLSSTVTILKQMGAGYAATHEHIQPDALESYLGLCERAQNAVKDAKAAYETAVNVRRERFAGLQKLATRIINAYAEAGAPKADLEDARGINRKIQGSRPAAAKDPGQDAEGKRAYSTSQQSFVNLTDHFDSLIKRAGSLPGYAPADADLLPAALQDYHKSLGDASTSVEKAASVLRTARSERNKLFYDEDSGMVARRKRLGNYFKSRKGGDDPLKGISFRNFG